MATSLSSRSSCALYTSPCTLETHMNATKERGVKNHLAPKARYFNHLPKNFRMQSPLINCSALRGKEKPRSSRATGVSVAEGPRRGSSTYNRVRASHNRRPLSTALLQKGWPPWSLLFVDASVSTARVAESSTSVPTATEDKFAVARRVVITTAGINAMRRTVITRTRSKADLLIAIVKKPTACVRPWLERGSRKKSDGSGSMQTG
jgi:hypothetical protein